MCDIKMKAMIVSRDGTPNIDPSRTLARSLKTLPYAWGCRCGAAIAGCVENLGNSAKTLFDELISAHLAEVPAMAFNKNAEPDPASTCDSSSRLSRKGNWEPKCMKKMSNKCRMMGGDGRPLGSMIG
jgi:hypothetical protein